MTFFEKKLPIYIRAAALLLLLFLTVLFFPFSALADEAENSKPGVKEMNYLDTRTFFDFADIEIEEWKDKADPETTNGGNIDAQYAIVVNLDTGRVMYERKPDDAIYPASTVKIMTAMVALENIPDLEVEIAATRRIVLREGVVVLNPGTVLTARELLEGLLIEGSNDCALVLAEYVGGSVENFCTMMNEKAKELGAKNTNFVNPTGFDDEKMLTTSRDLALIARHAYYMDEIVQMAGATNSEIGKEKKLVTLYNRNRMIRKKTGTDYFYTGTKGMSVGSTPDGGHCIITVAERDGLSYLAVVMKASSEDAAYRDTISLLSTCFNKFSVQKVVTAGVLQCQLENVKLAEKVDTVTLSAKNDISALLPNNIDVKKDIVLDNHVWGEAVAPIEQGTVFGELVVKYKGSVPLGTTELVANISIERSEFLYLMDIPKRFFTSRWFITALISAAVLFGIYCFIYYRSLRNQRRYRR